MSLTFMSETREVIDYDTMLEICNSNSCFDYVDEVTNGINTRTFFYRMSLINNDSFIKVGARNLRGTVFNKNTKECLALPLFKFFNIYENPHFTNYDEVSQWTIHNVYEKVDGCQIYFYKCNNELVCRTQKSCSNIESKIAMNIVNKNRYLKSFINKLVDAEYTPIFELISPINALSDLVFLAIRDRLCGQLLMNEGGLNFNRKQMQLITSIYPYYEKEFKTIDDIIKECTNTNIAREKVLEGFVVQFTNDELVKFKYNQYINLHKELSSIIGEMEIVNRIFNNNIDDIYILFSNNKTILNNITMIKNSINDTWHTKIDISKQFYNNHQALNKKDYYNLLNKEYDDTVIIGAAIIYYDAKGHPNSYNFNKLLVGYRARRDWRKSKYYMDITQKGSKDYDS